jgi:hypothetical protein
MAAFLATVFSSVLGAAGLGPLGLALGGSLGQLWAVLGPLTKFGQAIFKKNYKKQAFN